MLFEAAWKRHEQSGRPLPPIEARPQATSAGAPSATRWGGSGSDPAKSGEPPKQPAYQLPSGVLFAESITSSSSGALVFSSFSPSCSGKAVKIEGAFIFIVWPSICGT